MKNLNKILSALKHKKYLALTIGVEILFLISIVVLSYHYMLPGVEATQKAMEQMQNTMGQLSDAELPELESYLAQNSEFMNTYRVLLNYVLELIASVFIAYVFFKTISWHYTFKMIHKVPFTTTLIKFPLLAIFWTIISIIALILFAMIDSPYSITSKILLAIALLTIFYFAQISYSLIPAQKTFRKTFTKNIIKTYLINTAILAITIGVPILAIKHPIIAVPITLIITIPSMIFTRINTIIACWEK